MAARGAWSSVQEWKAGAGAGALTCKAGGAEARNWGFIVEVIVCYWLLLDLHHLPDLISFQFFIFPVSPRHMLNSNTPP